MDKHALVEQVAIAAKRGNKFANQDLALILAAQRTKNERLIRWDHIEANYGRLLKIDIDFPNLKR